MLRYPCIRHHHGGTGQDQIAACVHPRMHNCSALPLYGDYDTFRVSTDLQDALVCIFFTRTYNSRPLSSVNLL